MKRTQDLFLLWIVFSVCLIIVWQVSSPTRNMCEWVKTCVVLSPKNLVSCAKLVRCGTLNVVLQDVCWSTGRPLMLRWGWGRHADWIITDVREKCHSQLWFVFFTSHRVSGGGTPWRRIPLLHHRRESPNTHTDTHTHTSDRLKLGPHFYYWNGSHFIFRGSKVSEPRLETLFTAIVSMLA